MVACFLERVKGDDRECDDDRVAFQQVSLVIPFFFLALFSHGIVWRIIDFSWFNFYILFLRYTTSYHIL